MKNICCLVLLLVACDRTPCTTVVPEEAANSYLKTLGYSTKGASCTGGDTDGDGYVTCTYRLTEPDKTGRDTFYLSCGAQYSNNCTSGCKPKDAVPQ